MVKHVMADGRQLDSMRDIKERESYERYMAEKSDILEKLCDERGIKLWEEHTKTMSDEENKDERDNQELLVDSTSKDIVEEAVSSAPIPNLIHRRRGR